MLIDLDRCIGCGACVMACKVENGTQHGTYWCNVAYGERGTYPNVKRTALPYACMHCQNAPCVKHCPTGASYYDENGAVLVDKDKCIGCRVCANACPYNARHYNFKAPEENPAYQFGPDYFGNTPGLTPFEEFHAADHPAGKTEKCTLCAARREKGEVPACVETCLTKCRIFGDLDDPNSEISIAIQQKKAWRMSEELGTEPAIYYAGEM